MLTPAVHRVTYDVCMRPYWKTLAGRFRGTEVIVAGLFTAMAWEIFRTEGPARGLIFAAFGMGIMLLRLSAPEVEARTNRWGNYPVLPGRKPGGGTQSGSRARRQVAIFALAILPAVLTVHALLNGAPGVGDAVGAVVACLLLLFGGAGAFLLLTWILERLLGGGKG